MLPRFVCGVDGRSLCAAAKIPNVVKDWLCAHGASADMRRRLSAAWRSSHRGIDHSVAKVRRLPDGGTRRDDPVRPARV